MRFVIIACFIPFLALAQEPGVVADTVPCKANPKQTYALYVPKSYYLASKPPGLIFIFEPGARGKLPVTLYKDLADKYNVILACSNNSRNGPVQESLNAADAVLKDLFSKLKIDNKFLLSSGFSGGGRTAVQLAAGNPLFKGVITCGAAFPGQDPITKDKSTPFAEVIGRGDMNYQEALSASAYLDQLNTPHSLVMFNGGHQWPPPDSYEAALAWHYIRTYDDSSIVQVNYAVQFKNAIVQLDSGYLYEASRSLNQLKRDFQYPELQAKTDSALKILGENKKLRSQLKDVSRMNEREQFMQRDFNAQFVQHVSFAAPDSAYHPDYWRTFRRNCEKLIESEDKYKSLAGARLLDFGWRLCAEQHYMYMEYDQFRQAAMAARIWSLVLPDRPAPCVQAAKAFALLGIKDEMIEYLKMANARGLKDKQSLKNDKAFARYVNDESFLKLLK